MSGVYQRLKGIFRRSARTPQPSDDPYPESYNEQKPYLPTNPAPYQSNENRNNTNDDVESVRSDSPLQQTALQGQARGRTPVDESPSSTSINLPNSQLRTTSNGTQRYSPSNNNMNTNINPTINTDTAFTSNPSARAGLPPNNIINTNINPTVNNDTTTISNPSARAGLPTQDSSSDPPGNPISQTPLPPINQVPQSSVRDHFLSMIDRNRYPFKISPNSTLVGFPPSQNRQSSWVSRSSFTSQQNRPPFSTRLLPSRPQNHISNIEIDYPIANVLLDGNIPPSIAIKINEAVEHDRFGNTYHTQHYAYKPETQHIAIGNNQQIQRRSIGNSHHNGMRYIREISNEKVYPQKLIIDDRPQVNYVYQYDLNSFPVPIYHYTACAAPNDPMRYY